MNFPGCVLRDAGKGGLGRTAAWGVGVALGLTIASVSIVPLWVYLGKSPVWADREHERPSPWRLTRPRVLDTVCTAVPYAFGSQRRGQPNLARAVGVHNLNESAGGFAGLATLIWLAPQAWRARRGQARIAFLAALTAFGFLGAFGFPPVVNLLRATPILNMMDQRRLTLWVAFGLVLLGGAGLDRIAEPGPRRGALWVAGAVLLCLASFAAQRSEPWLRSRAEAHYARAAEATLGADASVYSRRADRQIRQALDHLPRQLWLTAAELSALAALAVLAQRGFVAWSSARLSVLGLTLVELLGFGYGLNPAIGPADDRPVPVAIARLQDGLGRTGRLIGLGEELPPNVAMRYGLADARAYDSVELTRNVDWLEPLYEPGEPSRSSRRTIAWSGVLRARDRLREAGVVAVVAATPPPAALPARCERAGSVWIAWLDAEPIVSTTDKELPTSATVDDGRVDVSITCARETSLIVRQTFDPGWRAEVDGQAAEIAPHRGAFLSVRVARGSHRVRLEYDPPEVRAAIMASLVAIAITVFALTGFRPIRSTRFPVLGLGPSRALGLESSRDLLRNSWPAYH